jgi:hypothetical protein
MQNVLGQHVFHPIKKLSCTQSDRQASRCSCSQPRLLEQVFVFLGRALAHSARYPPAVARLPTLTHIARQGSVPGRELLEAFLSVRVVIGEFPAARGESGSRLDTELLHSWLEAQTSDSGSGERRARNAKGGGRHN